MTEANNGINFVRNFNSGLDEDDSEYHHHGYYAYACHNFDGSLILQWMIMEWLTAFTAQVVTDVQTRAEAIDFIDLHSTQPDAAAREEES